MKTNCIAKLLLPLALAACLPVSAQSVTQLKQENAQLRAQLQALQAQCPTPASSAASWQGQHLEARLDTVRVGNSGRTTIGITISMTLRNTGSSPMVLNYETNSLSVTDSNGYNYIMYFERVDPEKTIKGIPATKFSRVDTSAVIMPGASRTVTFIADRKMNAGQTPGNRFDINATFVQFEDLGQGRIRKVRDYPVAFTNVTTSSRGFSSTSATDRISGSVGSAAERVLDRILK